MSDNPFKTDKPPMTTRPKQVQAPIALTMGDPSGIGLEITAMAWAERAANKLPEFFVIAGMDVFLERLVQLDLNLPLQSISSSNEVSSCFDNAVPVLPISVAGPVKIGKPSVTAATSIIASIEEGVREVMAGDACCLVTNPISKKYLYEAGFRYPGHTEFLAALSRKYGVDATPVMMMASDELKVVPLTIHIPLDEVSDHLSEQLIVRTVETVCRDLQSRFSIRSPRIVVTGLNPHAGESGTLGLEEQTIIEPAVEKLKRQGIDIKGPLSADTLFHRAVRRSYDVVVTMYHDQALIPIKTIAFDTAVNVTLGLPFVRTSPDHGTAFDIAGTGKANPSSLVAALKTGFMMADNQRRSACE